MKKLTLLLVLITLVTAGFAQAYFQQEVNYNIHVALDDQNHQLLAVADIIYKNNAPVPLREIVFHLWPNGYSNLNTAFAKQAREQGRLDFQFSKKEERGSIDSLSFTVDGKAVKWEYDAKYCDICRLILNEPVLPGGKITISTPFRVHIPSANFSRLGHSGQAYFIGQWYPKPAVYDNTGWHPIPYLNQGEFFSEFGSFDVFITLPQNYTVAATGNLTDCPAEQARLDSIEQATLKITSFKGEGALDFPSSRQMKTLHFHQDSVHDFAWFADKRYHVLQGEVELPVSHRKVKTAVYFTSVEANLWKDAVPYVNNAIYYYSLWVGEYPYDHATAVQGVLSAGAGMEYPTITIIGRSGTAKLLESVIVHEVGHNWFYGILGFNERQHPWMDEGINSYYDERYMEMKYPWRGKKITFSNMWNEFSGISGLTKYLSWAYFSGIGLDLPCTLPASDYPSIQYGTDVYFKTAFAVNYLAWSAGQVRFDMAMQQFYRTWQFKHPSPEDYRAVMQTSLNDSLNWFFNGVLTSPRAMDYKLRSVHKPTKTSTSLTVEIINKGEIDGPLPVTGINDHQADTTFWFPGFTGKKEVTIPNLGFKKIRIDPLGYLPEAFRRNNMLYTKGLCQGRKPLSLRFFYHPPDPEKNTIFILPAGGRNQYDKLMIGILLFNDPLFSKHWEWAAMPLYAFGTQQLNGMARLAYVVHPVAGLLREARFGIGYKRFSFEGGDNPKTSTKFTPSLELEFRSKNALSPFRTLVSFRQPHILLKAKDDEFWGQKREYFMNELACTLKNVRQLHPWSLRFVLQQNPEFARIFAEGKIKWLYSEHGKAIQIRVFAGHYMISNAYDYSDPGFHLSGIRGVDDIYFDGIFPGRTDNKGLFSRQFIEEEGGLKDLGANEIVYDDLASLNFKVDFPFRFPLRFFFDAGTTFNEEMPVTFGLSIPVRNDIFEVFFPLYYPNMVLENNHFIYHYGEKIRFTLNLQKLDFLKMAKYIIP